jgi:hypothetical protein
MSIENLIEAVASGNLELVKTYMSIPAFDPSLRCEELAQKYKIGYRPKEVDNVAFILAAQLGHLDIMKELLKDNRVKVYAEWNAALRYASREGFDKVVEFLLKQPHATKRTPGIVVEAECNRALDDACANGHTKVVKLLLRYADVDWPHKEFRFLKYAIQNKQYKVIKILLNDKRITIGENFIHYLDKDPKLRKIMLAREELKPQIIKYMLKKRYEISKKRVYLCPSEYLDLEYDPDSYGCYESEDDDYQRAPEYVNDKDHIRHPWYLSSSSNDDW